MNGVDTMNYPLHPSAEISGLVPEFEASISSTNIGSSLVFQPPFSWILALYVFLEDLSLSNLGFALSSMLRYFNNFLLYLVGVLAPHRPNILHLYISLASIIWSLP